VLLALAPVLALGVAACGGGFTASGDPLTESEAADLAAGLVEGGFAGFGSFAGAPGKAPSMPAATVTISLDDTAPCEGGGTVALKGSMTVSGNESGTSGTFGFDYTVTPSGCKTTSGDKTFTISGDPNLKVKGDFSFSSGTETETFEGSLSYDGKFNWTSSDGRAGACGVDLSANYDFTVGGTTATGSATLSGTVCGVTVNRSVSVTP
jgi:hypothetical protein